MIRRLNGEVLLYIMEPEEELKSLKFIAQHRPGAISDKGFTNWECAMPESPEYAKQLGLKGGYDDAVTKLNIMTWLTQEGTYNNDQTHQ